MSLTAARSAPQTTFLESWPGRHVAVAILSGAAIAAHLALRFGPASTASFQNWPLLAALLVGGGLILVELLIRLVRRQFGSDVLAGLSILVSLYAQEYLAGALVVLMLSGGQTLESYAVASASSVLSALARRMPSVAHLKVGAELRDVPLDQVAVGDELTVFPHETCPVDGVVTQGRGSMDESYLTGEPFQNAKVTGSEVLSGAINGENVLTIRAAKLAVDSRYAKIMRVMREAELDKPQLRRLGDQLGAWYTPLALLVAFAAWGFTGEISRFLAVLVVATPCPLLIAIPVAIIGSISLSARRGIIIRNPAALESLSECRTVIFDKTGTLTYGEPAVVEQVFAPGLEPLEVLALTASLEKYSKHPLSRAILAAAAAAKAAPLEATEVTEPPGEGLRGVVAGRHILVTSRKKAIQVDPAAAAHLPPLAGGMECVVMIDGRFAGVFHFRDEPRAEGRPFIRHLGPQHHFARQILLSGDREVEVRYLAERVGISEIHSGKSPEEKLAIVKKETELTRTLYVGDGINDAPALATASVGIALGKNSDVTSESADAVILDSSLRKVDELLHLSRRMRTIALQSAVGGMALSMVGMLLASAGFLPPVAGALAQEVIDVLAVLNALRAAFPPRSLTDF